MAERPGLFIYQTDLILLFNFFVAACILCAIISITSFILYVRTRLADRSEPDGLPDETEHSRRLASLDKKERYYQSLHFITLTLFVLFGVLILVWLSNRLNGHHLLDISRYYFRIKA